MKDGKIPLRAVIGGVDSSREKVYVGRIKKDGTLLPGKVVPSHKCCYVAYEGTECGSTKFQVNPRFAQAHPFNDQDLTYSIFLLSLINRF